MIFKYKELEISLSPELNMKMIHDNKKSFINNRNIKVENGIEALIHPTIVESEIIMVAETPEETVLLTQDEISSISSNTNTYISNINPQITSNINNVALNENFIWINKISGELFMCVDPTIDANVWIGQLGTIVKPTGFETISDDLLFHLKMDEITGTTVSSTTPISGVSTNCKIVPGLINNCLQFVGNSYITIDKFLPNLTGKIEINLFIYPESFASRQTIMSKSYAGEFSVVQEMNGTLSFLFGSSGIEGQGQWNTFQTTQPVLLNTWNHISIQRVDYQNARIFYGETEIPTVPIINKIVSVGASASTVPFYIGRGYAGYYRGKMEDIFFHLRNLSNDERTYLISRGA